MKDKIHLTDEGLNEILNIKNNMNNSRNNFNWKHLDKFYNI